MITLEISKCYGKVRVLFFPRDNSHFTRQVAHFTRSWSSGKMLAFQPRGFVFEPVGMRLFFTSIPKQKVFTFFGSETFRLCETFFRNFLNVPKEPPFLIFCNRTNVKKSQRVPFFRFFGTMGLPLKFLIFCFSSKIFY